MSEQPGAHAFSAIGGAVQVPGGRVVSSLLVRPAGARLALVLAHGAGAGMRHAFLATVATRLAACGVATFRFQFPYIEAGGHRPDPPELLAATVRAAVEAGAKALPDLPLIAGGKSLGGRMTSTAAAAAPLPGVRGLAFLGFPLHPPQRLDTKRAEHLARVTVPMLFLQGTRDEFADLPLLEPVVRGLGARATLHVVAGADHSFGVLRKSGRSDDDVLDELARVLSDWGAAL